MIKPLFLLGLLGVGVYFYNKGATNNLIIICALVLYILIFNTNKEHNTNTTSCACTTEAMNNIASLAADYKTGTLKAQNLTLDGNLTLTNGSIYMEGANGATISSDNNLNIYSGKQLYLIPKISTNFGRFGSDAGWGATSGDVQIDGKLGVSGFGATTDTRPGIGAGTSIGAPNIVYKNYNYRVVNPLSSGWGAPMWLQSKPGPSITFNTSKQTGGHQKDQTFQLQDV
jgi:hypothetical protein